MAKIGVTYEQVALACQSLLKEGQSPTFRNVMPKTGGAASYVVQSVMCSWLRISYFFSQLLHNKNT